MDPLDQALTNVIQNLIRIDDGESSKSTPISGQDTTPFKDSSDDLALETDDDKGDSHATIFKTDSCGENSRTPTIEPWCSLLTSRMLKRTATSTDLPSAVDNSESAELSSTVVESPSKQRDDDDDGETMKSKNVPSSFVSHVLTATTTNTTNTMPVFSIGPFPTSLSSIKSVQFSNPLIVGPSNRFFAPVFGATTAESENSANNSVATSSIESSNQREELTEGKEQRSFRPVESVADCDSISVDSSSSVDTVREFPTTDLSPASLSTSPPKEESSEIVATSSQKETVATSMISRTPEEVLAARADRLKRLEEQADWLVKKMNATSKRGSALCTRLEELHEAYGDPPVPPPMPDVLPSRRLPSCLPDLPRQVRKRNHFCRMQRIVSDSLFLHFVFAHRYLNRHLPAVPRRPRAKTRTRRETMRHHRMRMHRERAHNFSSAKTLLG